MEELIKDILKFRDDRNWKQFHDTKDLLLGLNIEVGELQEIFLWKDNEEINIQEVKYELADIFIFLVYIADRYNINLWEAINEKMAIHKGHYPINDSKNKTTKYNKL